MTAAGPWSVKGIDPKAREIAKDLARRSGLTLGDWLNQMIIEGGEPEAAPAAPAEPRRPLDDLYREAQVRRGVVAAPRSPEQGETDRLSRALETLATRVEAAEHRSVLAISGMDQSVMGVLSRLDEIEREHGGPSRLDGSVEEIRAAQARVAERLRRLEDHEGPRSEGLKALEAALGRMALRMDEEAARAEEARKEVRDAANASQGVAHRLERLETVLEAAPAAYADAEKVETVLTRMAERLDLTETRATAAVQSLQSSFAGLDARLRSSEARGVGHNSADMERRFQSLAHELSQRVEASRTELAQRIRAAADGRFDKMEATLRDLGGHVEQAEKRSAQAIDRIGREVLRVAHSLGDRVAASETKLADASQQAGERISAVESRSTAAVETMSGEVSRLADAMENRLRGADTAQAEALEKLGGEIARIAERLTERISSSDRRSAEAIDEVSDKVAKIGVRIDERSAASASDLSERIRASEERTIKLLAEARERLDQRLADNRSLADPLPQAIEDAPAQVAVALPSNADPFDPPPAPAEAEPIAALVEPAPPEEDPFARRDPFSIGESPFNPDDDFAPASWSAPPPEPGRSEPARTEPARIDSTRTEVAAEAPAARTSVFGPATFEEPAAPPTSEDAPFLGFSVSDFAPPPAPSTRPDQTSTRTMLEAAREAARRNAAGGRGDPGSSGGGPSGAGPLGSVPAPPLEPVGASSKPFGISFPGRRKKETAPTLRTIVLASVTAGAISAMGAGAYLLGGANHGSAAPIAVLEPPPTAAPLQALPAPATLAEAIAAPVHATPTHDTPPADPKPAADKPTPAAAATAAPKTSAQALYASAVSRIDGGDLGAVKDVRAAAEQGLPAAQFYLARLYEAGDAGLKKDIGEARLWTTKAAESGDPSAMYNLASYMYAGDGGPKDATGAAAWFRRSAEHGVVNGQYNLAQLYERGFGVPQSDAEAYKWYLVAAGSGDTEAKSAADSLKAKLAGDAQSGAERSAAQLHLQLAGGTVKTAAAQP